MDQSEAKETPLNYFDYVLKNSVQPDIEFVIKNEIIKAHKLILGKENVTFMTQFMSQPELNRIEFLDLDPLAFRIFINYLYTGKVSVENVTEDLLLVARKFSDPCLINFCLEKISQTLNKENASKRLLHFVEFKENQLLKETIMFVAKNFNDVKASVGFEQILENPTIFDLIFDSFGMLKLNFL